MVHWLPYSSHTSHHRSQIPWLSLDLLCHSKTDARFMQEAPKLVWSIPYISVTYFPSLEPNFIAYRSSKVSSCPDCIFESTVYSNCCCSRSFGSEIIRIGQSSQKMDSNNIVNFQGSTTILNACTKKVWNLIECIPYMYKYWPIVLVDRVFASSLGDRGSIPGRNTKDSQNCTWYLLA